MISSEQLLEQAAKDGTWESDDWPQVLEVLLTRLDSIVRSDFPIPILPPEPPPPRLVSPISKLDDQGSSQESTTSNKENAPARSPSARPPVPSFNDSQPATQHSATTDGASTPPSNYPPELTVLHHAIRKTLQTGFPKQPPHTIQRLAELILYPKRHYHFLPSYLHALDRVVNVSSNTTIFPLPQATLPNSGGVLNGANVTNNQTSAAAALGSDESLGGALLTPIPWLSPVRDSSGSRVASSTDRELQSESTEMVDGPNGTGRIETVSVVNGVMAPINPRSALTGAAASSLAIQQSPSTEQTLRAEGAVTQGELLRQEQEAGVVPVQPRSLRMTEEEMGVMDADEQEEEKPHARGPEEIGMEDTGPQERPGGVGLDMEAAVGRSRRESSVEREFSPQDASLSDAGSKDEVMKDVEEGGDAKGKEKKSDSRETSDAKEADPVATTTAAGDDTEKAK